MKNRIVELSQRDTPALRFWERWIDALAQTHIDEAFLLILVGLLFLALGWGVLCAFKQASIVGIVVLPIAMLAKHGKEKK